MTPLYSFFASGWFGKKVYKRTGINPFPYPIGKLPGGLKNEDFYNQAGWVYQTVHGPHGVFRRVIRPPLCVSPRTHKQQANRTLIRDGVFAWQALTSLEKLYWNKKDYPRHMSGYNRFLRVYLNTHSPPVDLYDFILTEAGLPLATESLDFLVLEAQN